VESGGWGNLFYYYYFRKGWGNLPIISRADEYIFVWVLFDGFNRLSPFGKLFGPELEKSQGSSVTVVKHFTLN